MPLITVHNLTKYYGTELLLDHISFAIDHRERLGLIGANGTGKTTLCRILMGQEPYEDDSELHFARTLTVGYLSQDVNFGDARTPWEVVMGVFADLLELEARLRSVEERMAAASDDAQTEALLEEHSHVAAEYEAAGGHEFRHRAAAILTGLGVPEADFERPLDSFSGGEQRRVSLARLLLSQPQLLLLDEPTNHLDITGIEWLEQYLRNYQGAVIAISHDRRFLDAVVTRILELEGRTLAEYTGGYSQYLEQKEQRLLTYERTYERQQEELKKQLSFIRWALGTAQEKKVKAAKSRLKLLEKMDYVDPPPAQRRKLTLRFEPRLRGGDEVLELKHLGMHYGDKRLFEDVNLFVRRGQRVGIVGPNGCGKTTLLRIALGYQKPTEGEARLGTSVEIGYHRQDEFGLNPEHTVYEEFKELMPDAEQTEIRSLLARFLFVEEDVFKSVADLSGGEQSRLSLAKLILQRPSVLVLDEPTNHLDIDSRNALEAALREYRGTILVVSHDRYFLDAVANRLLLLHDGRAIVHEGNWSAYIAHRQEIEAEAARIAAEADAAKRQENQRLDRLARQEKKRRRQQAAHQGGDSLPSLEQVEQRAHYLETQLAKIRDILGRADTYSLPARVQALEVEYEKLNAELAEIYDLWERVEQSLT
jgi:ATP-binding cassette subfamily F protein 3